MSEKTILVENRFSKYADDKADFDFETTENTGKIEAETITFNDINRFTYKDLRETVNIICDLFFKIFFLGYGILKFFAISSVLLKFFHHDNIFILLFSSLFAFLPIIGSIFGICGACTSWGWNVKSSILIFTIPYFIVNGPIFMIILFETYKDIKRWRSEKQV